MKTELLAPAGSMEALKAAIANGCDAIYLGTKKFGARAYSANFDYDMLEKATDYAHLRGVKIYVTMNTIVFEDEIKDMKEQLEILYNIGVDGVIVQDLAALNVIVSLYPDMEVHCSTQMGIDDAEGALLMKELGAKRVVLAREVPIEKVKQVREKVDVKVEVFAHGALCVSFSGNCLMSGLIGFRSGNRGRCVGSCRKEYDMINTTTGDSLGSSYILSMKDLNTVDYVSKLDGIDSLKIEGRMKEPEYVANVVATYRKAIDGNATKQDKADLQKTFNRTYTKGYLFHEDKKDITNTDRPNNFGYEIGKVSKFVKGYYEIKLNKALHQNDIIRISHGTEDVNLKAVKLYDKNGNLINKADKEVYIKIKEKLNIGDLVYITKDYNFYKELDNQLDGEYKRFALDMQIRAYVGNPLVIDAKGLGESYRYQSEETLDEATNLPSDENQVKKQLGKLGDTVFTLGKVDYHANNVFIPSKLLNNARREIVQALYDRRLTIVRKKINKKNLLPEVKNFWNEEKSYLTATVSNKEQYQACKDAGIKDIYFENIIPRNLNEYKEMDAEVLVGGYGGIQRYKATNPFITDYSLNVVNSASVAILQELGAKRVTLSYEMNSNQIQELVDAYQERYEKLPNLELIVYGRAPLMVTNYCPLKAKGKCTDCRKNSYELKDKFGSFPLVFHQDCTVTILNGRVLNLLDEMPTIHGIEAFRLNFTTEPVEEVKDIVKKAQKKLSGELYESVFEPKGQTRGHFNKEIL